MLFKRLIIIIFNYKDEDDCIWPAMNSQSIFSMPFQADFLVMSQCHANDKAFCFENRFLDSSSIRLLRS